MTRLPSLRPKQVVRALKKAGFCEKRQSGSHLHMEHEDGREVVVPMHNREMKRGTLLSIIKHAGFSVDEFQGLL